MKAAVAAMALLVLAGCCSPPVRPSEVPPGAPSTGGIGDRVVRVDILAPDTPAPDVPVLFFWVPPERPQTDGKTNLVALGLRTAADGSVVARVPGNATIHVTAGGGLPGDFGGLLGWTEEWMLDAAPADGLDAALSLAVYPRSVAVDLNGTWSPVAATTFHDIHLGPMPWQPQDILPGATAASRQGFADRIARVQATVTWENGGTAQADLALAAYHASVDGSYCHVANVDQTAATGVLVESFDTHGSREGFACSTAMPAPSGSPALLVGPASGRVAVAPMGLPYRLNATLQFGYPSSFEALCERMAGAYQASYTGRPEPESGDSEASEETYSVQFQDPESGNLSQPVERTATDVDVPGLAPAFAAGAVLLLALAVRRRT